ncbi:MAG: beta-propeller fold lactonase family protein [Acidobacteriia bacterium]|nr:beta-propeller fold lactonase family protein [Terriglobia bacterium]
MKLACALLALSMGASAATLLVLNKEDATMAIVDPASGKVLGTVATGAGPHEVATDGKLAFVGNYGAQTPGNTISVIDIAAKKELHRVDVSPLQRPHGVFVHDGKAYFTAETNRLIARYDPASNKIDWMMGTGLITTHMVMVTRDGNKIFTSNIGSDAIAMFERGQNPANWNLTVIPVGKGPEAIEVSPDGKEIWTAHSRDGGVSIIDVAAKKVVGTIDVHTKRSNRLKITPDGKHVLISDLDAGEVVVLDRNLRKEIKRIPVGKAPEGILIVPDGSRAYIAVNGDNFLAVLDLKTLQVTGKVQTGRGPDGMAWVQ